MSAVRPATETLAASSKLRPAGLRATLDSRAVASSANVPAPDPKTSSPGLNRGTADPTASTMPARSTPRGDERLAPHHVPVEGVDGGRLDPDEDAVVGDRRWLDLLEAEDLGPSVTV